MKINYFKDILFELLNETTMLDIVNIDTDDKNNILQITLQNNDIYELKINKKDGNYTALK